LRKQPDVQGWISGKPIAEAAVDGLLLGSLAAGVHAVTFVFLLNPSINALCHWPHRGLGGYQNSHAAHAARTFNNWIVALLTAGEGFHNNHHDQPGAARFRETALRSDRGLGVLGRHRAAVLGRARRAGPAMIAARPVAHRAGAAAAADRECESMKSSASAFGIGTGPIDGPSSKARSAARE
jgi:hypothetical protein